MRKVTLTEIQTISESCKKILCNSKIYKEVNFFEVPHNKVCLAVIRSITNKSYNEIGKHYKKSWFSIYASVKDCQKNGLKAFTNKVISLVKEDIK
jgi:putative heme iron utilization protein